MKTSNKISLPVQGHLKGKPKPLKKECEKQHEHTREGGIVFNHVDPYHQQMEPDGYRA